MKAARPFWAAQNEGEDQAEDDGSVGTVCIYQATGEDALRKHADLADLPVDEVIAVADTVIVRPDPVPAESAG